MKWTSVGKTNGKDVSFSGHWLWIGNDEADIQPLAKDPLQYQYTHGGKIYRRACEMVWDYMDCWRWIQGC